jgi:hypothetical protein
MRVIGVGFGRTGTASLKMALERLDAGPCYHMFDVLDQAERAKDWLAVVNGEAFDWDEIFAGFRSTVDWPGAAFWRELLARYPDAKVILTVRDPESWYNSAAQTIFRGALLSRSPVGRVGLRLLATADRSFGDFIAMANAVVMQRVFDGRIDDRAYATEVFRAHIDEVCSTVPAQRLLVFDVAQGWKPLCEFLDVPVPEEPFPHVNDTAEFRRHQQLRMLRAALPVALAAAAAVGIAAATVTAGLRRKRR